MITLKVNGEQHSLDIEAEDFIRFRKQIPDRGHAFRNAGALGGAIKQLMDDNGRKQDPVTSGNRILDSTPGYPWPVIQNCDADICVEKVAQSKYSRIGAGD